MVLLSLLDVSNSLLDDSKFLQISWVLAIFHHLIDVCTDVLNSGLKVELILTST